ncbi:MAG: putative ABC transporter permease [Bacilli bacterium]|nr:putative ABC transporter permease [Bacilli bacterium]
MKEKLLIFKNDNINLNKTIYLLILIMVISGVFGFIYETIFYKIDLGYFVKRGSSYGPWIPIYALGGLFITLLTYKLKKNPFIVFVLSSIITGLLEYITGYVFYEFKGIRLWDYNTEIWNYGNINGYICLRSVLFFGISSLLLIYLIIPLLKKLTKNIKENTLQIISISLGLLFLIDVLVYGVLN